MKQIIVEMHGMRLYLGTINKSHFVLVTIYYLLIKKLVGNLIICD
jgi:hypothetical protein